MKFGTNNEYIGFLKLKYFIIIYILQTVQDINLKSFVGTKTIYNFTMHMHS